MSKYCCASFEKAYTERGTDSESYGVLIYSEEPDKPPFDIGDSLPPMVFCPWCGTMLPEKAP